MVYSVFMDSIPRSVGYNNISAVLNKYISAPIRNAAVRLHGSSIKVFTRGMEKLLQ